MNTPPTHHIDSNSHTYPLEQQVAAKAQAAKAELSSLARQQETDRAEEHVRARELQTHEEAAVSAMCMCMYVCVCVLI